MEPETQKVINIIHTLISTFNIPQLGAAHFPSPPPYYCIVALVPIKTLSSTLHILRYPSIITKPHGLAGDKTEK